MDAATVVAPVVVVVAAAAERRGLTGRPLLAWDPFDSQTVVAETARVMATVDAGPIQRPLVAEAKDFQRGLPVLCSTGFIVGHVEPYASPLSKSSRGINHYQLTMTQPTNRFNQSINRPTKTARSTVTRRLERKWLRMCGLL